MDRACEGDETRWSPRVLVLVGLLVALGLVEPVSKLLGL